MKFSPLFPSLVMSTSFSRRSAKAFLASTAILSILLTSTFSLTTEITKANHTECSDGRDNDNDRKVDYPQDDDCESVDDDYEGVSMSGMFITLTDGKEEVSQGGSLVYVITLKQQRENVRTVNIDFHVPAQANIVSASDGGSTSFQTARWTSVNVYKNVTRTLQVHVNVRPDTPLGQYLVARVRTENAEATDTTLVSEVKQQSTIDYSVSVSDGREYVQPGEVLNYTVRVRNTGDETIKHDVRLNLPSKIYFMSASDGGVQQSYTVVWPQLEFAPGITRTLSAQVQVDPRAENHLTILARANVGGASDTDNTTINIGTPDRFVSATITDQRDTARVGESINYTITVKNKSDIVATQVAVDASLPQYGQFTSATDGGYYDGTNVRWVILQLAPGEERKIYFTAKVRPDAPDGTNLIAGVVANGVRGTIARDTTRVSRFGANQKNALFRKTADRAEVMPGGSIRYTLTVINTLDHSINDATIRDLFDTQYLSLESMDDANALISQNSGELLWRVPRLAPGEMFRTSYILRVAKGLPPGMELSNRATLQGSDVASVSIDERVMTTGAAVMMADVPRTGAALDFLFLAFISILGYMGVRAQSFVGVRC